MEPETTRVEHLEQSSKTSDCTDDGIAQIEPTQQIHAKTIAIVGGYFAQVFHLVGAGFLAQNVTAVVGGPDQAIWLAATLAIMPATLGAPVSQAADYWGRKWFVICLSACGCIGCIVVSRADSIGMVIAGQTVGGIALGAQPVLHAIPSEIIPRKYRPLAQSSVNVAAAMAGVAGLLVGGALTVNNPEGFRNFWYIAAALYAVSTLIILVLYNPPVRELQTKYTTFEKLARLDWIGYFLLILGLVLFSVALTSSLNPYPWTNPHIISTFTTGTILLIAFFIYEWRFTKTGLLHHSLFSKGRNFAIAELCIFVEGTVFFASNNYFGYEVVVLYGKNQFTAGLYYTIAWFTFLVATCLAGVYCSRTKTVRLPLMLAFGSFTLYNALMATLKLDTLTHMLGFTVFLGLGLGIALNVLIVTSQLSTPPELISTTTGLMIATRSFGGTFGLCIYTAIFSSTLSGKLGGQIAAATVPLGLKPIYLGELIGALLSNNPSKIAEIPGISPTIVEAAGVALRQTFVLCFRYVWIAAAALAFVALVGSFFIVNPTAEFTAHIDAPLEVQTQSTEAIVGSANLHGEKV